jgi:hypothetical protein
MQISSAQPAAGVLNYARATPQDAILRRLRAAVTVLLCMALCGGLGWLVQPTLYRAGGVVWVAPARWTHPVVAEFELREQQARDDRQAKAVAGMTSQANLIAAVALLKPRGFPHTSASIALHLHIDAIPNSGLIHVAFDDPDPKAAAAVANAIVESYVASGGIVQVGSAGMPPRQMRNRYYPVGGLAVGLLTGVFIAALRWK